MQLFIATPTPQGLRLLAEEAHHALHVLRHRPGDELQCVDGAGCHYRARIAAATKHGVDLDVLETTPEWGEPAQPSGLIFSLLKNRDRMEWLLEKAVELGATHLWPVVCHRTERTAWNPERAQRVLAAGLKQNLRSRLPHLPEPMPLAEALALPLVQHTFTLRLVPHCNGAQRTLPQVARGLATQPALFCIGPEGDFTPTEVGLAQAAGFEPLSLGHTRLRAETAGIFCLAASKALKGC
jgi:16S rRNA (uracil1498-N3)-methyltransferase